MAAEISLPSLSESYRSVPVRAFPSKLRRLWAFCGPGYLVAVGYIDPGNWATDLAGGARFGYSLLWTIALANVMAVVLQSLSLRLGIATGHDLAQACRAHYSRPWTIAQWLLCEVAIIACDLAEVLGTALAFKLLFGLPLAVGLMLTACDVALILGLQKLGFRYLEGMVVFFLAAISLCFGANLWLAGPDWAAVTAGFVPDARLLHDPQMRYLALGILGATVMPHNLYLHSSIVQTRGYAPTGRGKREAIRFATFDLIGALSLALLLNAAILITAGAVLNGNEAAAADIEGTHRLLSPLLGTSLAGTLFALALLFSGQSSTISATLAGQVVVEGFLKMKISQAKRRALTRALALVPALAVVAICGETQATKLLIFSQVVLAIQLPFAIWPLVSFTRDRRKMGSLVSPRWLSAAAALVGTAVVAMNAGLLLDCVSAL